MTGETGGKTKRQSSFFLSPSTQSVPSAETSSRMCFAQLLRAYDPELGGFSRAPKFPQPVNTELLFALAARGGDRGADRNRQALRMCDATLRAMARGGICDHVSRWVNVSVQTVTYFLTVFWSFF